MVFVSKHNAKVFKRKDCKLRWMLNIKELNLSINKNKSRIFHTVHCKMTYSVVKKGHSTNIYYFRCENTFSYKFHKGGEKEKKKSQNIRKKLLIAEHKRAAIECSLFKWFLLVSNPFSVYFVPWFSLSERNGKWNRWKRQFVQIEKVRND